MIYVTGPCQYCKRVSRVEAGADSCLRCKRAIYKRSWRMTHPEQAKALAALEKEYQRAYQAQYRKDPMHRERNRAACRAWRERMKAEALHGNATRMDGQDTVSAVEKAAS